jgi:hypothetical protein
MDATLVDNIDRIAKATGKGRTEIIEKFCTAGINGMQRLIEEKKKFSVEHPAAPDGVFPEE